MTSAVQKKIQRGWHVLDVGADIGYYSLLFASKCDSCGAAAAFEPDPEPWPILNENIAMHAEFNIRPFPFALSDHYGHGMMKQGGRGQLFPDKEAEGEFTSMVEMLPFDDFWPQLGWNRLDLIKIDVEGAELSVLQGMKKVIEKYHPHILVEIHPRQLRDFFNSSAEELLHLITAEFSYRLSPVDKQTLEMPETGNITVWGDWVDKAI